MAAGLTLAGAALTLAVIAWVAVFWWRHDK